MFARAIWKNEPNRDPIDRRGWPSWVYFR